MEGIRDRLNKIVYDHLVVYGSKPHTLNLTQTEYDQLDAEVSLDPAIELGTTPAEYLGIYIRVRNE